jgi:diguanylate cyclase (GGDEF)-like protein
MLAAVGAITATLGFLLGAVCLRPRLRRTRAELCAALRLAELDALTGLLNRSGLQRRYQLLAAAGTAPAAVLLDLDDFKRVNDTWGHPAGDAHLTAVADRLVEVCGQRDAVAGRLAGDEFLLLVPGDTPGAALEVVEAVFAALNRPTTLPVGDRDTITVVPRASAGLALPKPDSEWGDLLHRADIALYHAKLRRGNAVLHTTGMRQPTRDTDLGRRLRTIRQKADSPLGVPMPVGPSYPGTALHW